MKQFQLNFWNEFKRVCCYYTGLRCLAEKMVLPWKKYESLSKIPLEEIKTFIEEKNIKVIILDMDGTLKHYKKGLLDINKDWVNELKKVVKIYMISNANDKLSKPIATELNIPYIFSARKPWGDGLKKILATEKVNSNNVIVIGDAVIADIWGAKRIGIEKTILLDDINIKDK